MPGRLRNTLLAGLFALALAGCGSGDEGTIPGDDSDALVSLTEAVRTDVANGDCDAARAHANELADQVRALPSGVDPDVIQGLTDAAANLVEQTQDPDQCAATTGASGEAGAETTTEPTTTEPTTTEPTTTSSTTEEQTTTPSDENDQGGGQGGGTPQTPSGQGETPPGQTEGGGNQGGEGASGEFDPSGGIEPGGDRTTP